MDKDLRKVIEALEEQGFTVTRTKSGHHMVRLNGNAVALIAGTPSDVRGFRNTLSHLRRAGFVWPPGR